MERFTLERNWNLLLLASLLFSLMVLPLFESIHSGRSLAFTGLGLTLLITVMATKSRFRILLLVMLLITMPVGIGSLFVDSPILFVACCLAGSTAFLVAGGTIVTRLIKSQVINLDSVFAAISAYLLIGMAWAFAYWAVHTVAPGSFSAEETLGTANGRQLNDYSNFVYYSFVTMSTLGYGDIIPTHQISRTLSWIQSVTGQFYMAIIIAWLVSSLPRPGRD